MSVLKKQTKWLFIAISLIVISTFSCKYKSSIQLSEVNNPEATLILNNYNLLLQKGENSEAIQFLDSARQTLTHLSTIDLWTIYKDKHLFYLDVQRNLTKAFKYVDSMEFVLNGSKAPHNRERVNTFFARGNVLFAKKEFTEAYKSYYDGREFALKNLDECLLSEFTGHLAYVKYNQLQFKDAIAYLKVAIKENSACNSSNNFYNRFVTIQARYNTLGVAYTRIGKLDSALFYYEKGLAFINTYKTINDDEKAYMERASGVISGNLGGVLLIKGNFAEAEALLKQSIAFNDRIGYEMQDARTAKVKLAELYLKTNRAAAGLVLLNHLVKELENESLKNGIQTDVLLRCYELLYKYYEQQLANINLAYVYGNKYHRLKETIDKINNGNNSINMDTAFELNAQKHKAKILEKDNEIKKVYLIGSGLLVLISAIIFVVLWRDRKKSKHHIANLNSLNYQKRQTLTALEQSQEENNRILQIVAHDLRNPLSGIAGISDLMLMEEGLSEETKMELTLIKDASTNSLALVNELIQVNFSIKELKMEEIEVQELIQHCADLLKLKAEGKHQHIITNGFPANVKANREKLWRVLSNLIANAIKFSPAGSQIKISMRKDNHQIVIAVEDKGMGIPSHLRNHLFDMFTVAKRSGTAGEQSFGMGLFITKQIILAHGGKIWFESVEGKGTTFSFSLIAA